MPYPNNLLELSSLTLLQNGVTLSVFKLLYCTLLFHYNFTEYNANVYIFFLNFDFEIFDFENFETYSDFTFNDVNFD